MLPETYTLSHVIVVTISNWFEPFLVIIVVMLIMSWLRLLVDNMSGRDF